MRGTGGIHITSSECTTEVPGLYAAGDAATRENVAGATSGGGSVNASWAMWSGWWAGRGAAGYARRRGAPGAFRTVSRALGTAGLKPTELPRAIDPREVVAAVRDEVIPLDRNYFRDGGRLAASRDRLDALWRDLRRPGRRRDRPAAGPRSRFGDRGGTLVGCGGARRTESRGMHRRTDMPGRDDALAVSLLVSGLDEVNVRVASPAEREERAS